ncbi:aldose 1-epimerase [Paenibacillus turpanensis]|uniref:aldose 1-epimerase n=1 Tax=Paenibacillus turpanensis TaxID=2689078 RepID=UPI001407F2D7|nr:aldose 1-epimerase [Paenibacillus turpanensis]
MPITHTTFDGYPVVILENEQLTAHLLPAFGNNLIKLWDKHNNRDVLRTPDKAEELQSGPGQFGTPLMMPPNRLRYGAFTYNGQAYQFDTAPNGKHHSHGFLRTLPWQVTGTKEEHGTLTVTSELSFSDFPDVLRQYPHPLHFIVTYELKGNSLVQHTTVENRGSSPAPFGYGLHTWFLLDGKPEEWSLRMPCESLWELDEEKFPTGTLLPLGNWEAFNHEQGLQLQNVNLDDPFQIGSQPVVAELQRGSYRIRYSCSEQFKQWVIFTKGKANQFICLEPYTWVTDSPNLQRLPSDVTGFQAIAPGDEQKLTVTLELENL